MRKESDVVTNRRIVDVDRALAIAVEAQKMRWRKSKRTPVGLELDNQHIRKGVSGGLTEPDTASPWPVSQFPSRFSSWSLVGCENSTDVSPTWSRRPLRHPPPESRPPSTSPQWLRASAGRTSCPVASGRTAAPPYPTTSSLGPQVRSPRLKSLVSFFPLIWLRNGLLTGVEVEGVKVEEAFFRGRKLQGATLTLPDGYRGDIFF